MKIIKILSSLLLTIFMSYFSYADSINGANGIGGATINSCKSIFLKKTFPVIDLNADSEKIDFFKAVTKAAFNGVDPYGNSLSFEDLSEVAVAVSKFNLNAVPDTALINLERALTEHKKEQRLQGLSVEQAVAHSLIRFNIAYKSYLQFSNPDKKQNALKEMEAAVSSLSKVPNALTSPGIMWHLASMKYILNEKETALDYLLIAFNREIKPSMTLIKALIQVAEKNNVQLPDTIISKISTHSKSEFDVHFDINNQWGPYVRQEEEQKAYDIKSFFPL